MEPLSTVDLHAQVRIRRCREEDLPALEWFGQFTDHRELIREAFERQQRGEVSMLVAELQGFPVGQIWVDFTRKAADSVGVLWAYRILDPVQGLGVGRALLRAAEAEIAGAGLPCAEIAARYDNVAARDLYERRGYSLIGHEQETWSYQRPDGATVTETSEHWLLRKPVTVH
jgi:ribosomal protein S18 acetylase RimI-like enzyme